jgi:hypothetical protein
MDTLKIHNPTNQQTRYHKHYNFFWDALTASLEKKYIVQRNEDFADAYSSSMNVKLKNATVSDYTLRDCDYIIENITSGDFYILSTSDVLHANVVCENENPYLKKVLFSQYIEDIIKSNVNEKHLYKYSPWIYFQSSLLNLEEFYYKRQRIEVLKNKMYFRGNTRDRDILKHFSKNIIEFPEEKNPSEWHYFEELIQYKLALSVGGVGEICYRDIECMAVGTPFIRFEFASSFSEPLIPNVHYISVDRPSDLPTDINTCGVGLDRLGKFHHAKLIEKRYLEVINDEKFLRYIAKNARDYYEKYLQYPNNVNYTIKLLGL